MAALTAVEATSRRYCTIPHPSLAKQYDNGLISADTALFRSPIGRSRPDARFHVTYIPTGLCSWTPGTSEAPCAGFLEALTGENRL
jgi:hypothetical protein